MNKIILTLVLIIVSPAIFGQGKISGNVTDSEGEALIGANVVIQGTTKGAQTNIDGNYTIEDVTEGEYVLVASYIGYAAQKQNIKVNNGTVNVNFVLEGDQLGLDEVIVTGVFNEKSKLESSVAITTMTPDMIRQRLPRGTGDLLNAIPGTYVDNSGGEVGNRVFARGMASGTADNTGYRYVSLQEDGLPVMSSLVQFATADMFSRVDVNVARLEAIRGGSSAVTAPNSPGGIYNFISKEGGNTFGGTASLQGGSNGRNLFTRLDLGFGGPIAESGLTYYVGGFYRYDEGARDIPFTANKGGQLKGNLVYNYNSGKVKLYTKYINDKVTQYRPIPFSNLETLEPFTDALVNFDRNYSSTFTQINTQIPDYSFGQDGKMRDFNTDNGIDVDVRSIGVSWQQDIGTNWTLDLNSKYTKADQRYLQFIGNIVVPTDISLAGLGLGSLQSNAEYRDARTGELLYQQSSFNGDRSKIGNNVFATIPLDMTNDITDFMEQITLNGKLGNHSVTLGSYFSRSTLKSTWHADIMMGTFEPNSRPLRVTHVNPYAPGILPDLQITDESGFVAYNQVTMLGFEGTSQTLAAFINDVWEVNDDLHIDFGVRYERLKQDGFKRGWDRPTGNDPIFGAFPNGADGDYTTIYDAVTRVHNDEKFTYDESYNMWAFSLGMNYKLDASKAVFLRASKGNKAPDHEQYISNFENTPIQRGVVEKVYQLEGGFKIGSPKFSLFGTAFYSYLDDITFRVFAVSTNTTFFTTPTFNKARTIGLELEAIANPIKGLSFRLLTTLQDPRYVEFALYNTNGTSPKFDSNGDVLNPLLPADAEITFGTPPDPMPNSDVSDDYFEDMSGNQVNDIPKIINDLTGSYEYEGWVIFLNWRYTGKYQYNKRNDFQLPAYSIFNAGISKSIGNLVIAANVNNLFNAKGVTRTEGAALLDGNKEFFTKEFLDDHRNNAFGLGVPGSVWAVPVLPRMLTGSLTFNF